MSCISTGTDLGFFLNGFYLETSEASKRAERVINSWGVWGGAVSPPRGVRGAGPENFSIFHWNTLILVHSEKQISLKSWRKCIILRPFDDFDRNLSFHQPPRHHRPTTPPPHPLLNGLNMIKIYNFTFLLQPCLIFDPLTWRPESYRLNYSPRKTDHVWF